MCVIILKKPGIIIPFDKLQSACTVNNDGWGLSVLQSNDKLLTYKDYKKEGNDPESLAEIIERHKDNTQFIHLRYTTRGSKSVENCHPFPLIEEPDYQLYLMHNGTLSFDKFKYDNESSDTRAFCEQYAGPTAKAFYAVSGKDLILNENFIRMMDHFISSNWYFLLYDNLGNYKVLGGTGQWYDAEGTQKGTESDWWASNTYSFNRTHRGTSDNYYGAWSGQGSEDDDTGYYRAPFRDSKGDLVQWDYKTKCYVKVEERSWEREFTSSSQSTSTSTALSVVKPETKGGSGVTSIVPFLDTKEGLLKAQSTSLGFAFAEAKRKGLDWASHSSPEERPTFVDLCDLNSLDEACVLTEEDLEELVGNYPEAAVVLIMDLLHTLWMSKRQSKEKAA